jgi:hypothetical protein
MISYKFQTAYSLQQQHLVLEDSQKLKELLLMMMASKLV